MSERIELEITPVDFAHREYESWRVPNRHHFVYILENGREAYIGQTGDIIRRSREHQAPGDRCYGRRFRQMYVITAAEMHESSARHIERVLIKLMTADGRFRIDQAAGTRRYYPRRTEFELGFDRLWPKLEALGLVRHRDFQAVLNMGAYKYSPYTCLTQDQQEALNAIVNAIESDETVDVPTGFKPRPIYVEGDAGTGKTVVASSLYYYFRTHPDHQHQKIGLVYAVPAMRRVIQRALRPISKELAKGAIAPTDVSKGKYDIVICDEAQRLRRNKNLGVYITRFREANARLHQPEDGTELSWLLVNACKVVLFRDRKQRVIGSDMADEMLDACLLDPWRGVRPVELRGQMRIRAGDKYVPYIHDVLHQRAERFIPFEGYELRLYTDLGAMLDSLRVREREYGLCRLCGGYAWPGVSRKTPGTADVELDGVSLNWNGKIAGWIDDESRREEVGSIYTLAGLDLNWTGVIIGPELYLDPADGCIKVDKRRLFDDKMKKGSTPEELLSFVLNAYGVFLTRGIRGTFVYVCDDALREYLKQYIPLA